MSHIIRKRGAVHTYFQGKREFLNEVQKCIDKASVRYPFITKYRIPVVFVKAGNRAGAAIADIINGEQIYNIEFSIDAISKDWDHLVEDTIPHEIAHILDHMINGKMNGHGPEWRCIAQSLGCSGERCHSIKVARARAKPQRTKYQYQASCGTVLWLSTQMHNKVQCGNVRIVKKTKGLVTAEHCTGIKKVVV